MIKSYKQPQTVEEAVSLKKGQGSIGYYAGGTCLNHADCGTSYTSVIALDGLALDTIEIDNGALKIGSMVRLQELIDSPLVMPVIKDASRAIYSRNVRNMATVGGNIGACWDHSALVPSLIALEAVIETAEGASYPIGTYLSGKYDSELITAVRIPLSSRACVVKRVRQSSGSKTILSFALSMRLGEDGRCVDPILAATGFSDRPIRLETIEQLLTKREEHSVFEFDLAFRDLPGLKDDELGTRSYKTYISARTVVSCADACREVLA